LFHPLTAFDALRQNFLRACLDANNHVANMAKLTPNRAEEKHKQSPKNKAFIAVPKKALDPTLASLFASSVRIHHPRHIPHSLIWSQKS
jgi:hypothetical protein